MHVAAVKTRILKYLNYERCAENTEQNQLRWPIVSRGGRILVTYVPSMFIGVVSAYGVF